MEEANVFVSQQSNGFQTDLVDPEFRVYQANANNMVEFNSTSVLRGLQSGVVMVTIWQKDHAPLTFSMAPVSFMQTFTPVSSSSKRKFSFIAIAVVVAGFALIVKIILTMTKRMNIRDFHT